MRHSRSEAFRRAGLAPAVEIGGPWQRVDSDPNAAAVIARRARTLSAAWRLPIPDRVRFLEERCSDRRVLDVGCVAHDVDRMDSPNWLHRRLARVAASCLGVDVLEEGVQAMVSRGFDAVAHDLTTGLGPIEQSGPFDVIVAGELIEHVVAVDMLFRTAAEALAPDGVLILTTPNPYAPHRVRAGQLGIVWENVDHILYAFPSGIAELAERNGLFLSEAATVDNPGRSFGAGGAVGARLRSVKRRILGKQYLSVGFATTGKRRQRRVPKGAVARMARRVRSREHRFLGETFVYVIARPLDPDTSPGPDPV